MKKYLYFLTFCTSLLLLVNKAQSQDCYTISASCQTFESRCASTGKILVTVSNGSGTYNYRVTGPVTTSYSSSNEITGLPAGTYTVTVKDVINGCIVPINNVVVTGTYNDPRFQLNKSDITCLNANDGTISLAGVQDGRSPFVYTIVAPSVAGAGTTSATGTFSNLVPGEYYIRLTDSCGGIQTRNITIINYDWWIHDLSVTKSACNIATFNITVKDTKGNLNNGSGSAAFSAFKYAVIRAVGDTVWSNTYSFNVNLGNKRSVTVLVQDGCGNTKTTIWNDNLQPTVASAVGQSNYTCTTFNASITGQQNLSSPSYCIYDNTNTQLSCNTTGVFNNLPYGSYCIEIKDICYDTTITRCFTVSKPIPSVYGQVTISNLSCTTADVSVSGQTNLFNPQFCLFDAANTPLGCNTTGIFTGLPLGNYCIEISSPGCYDTTIKRCFSVIRPDYSQSGSVNISNIACTTFTATVTGQTNFTTANYCLYDNLNNLIICNSTGVFNNLLFGSYCITTSLTAGTNSCYDTSFTRCFTVNRPIPSVAANVTISNKTCSTFDVSVTGQTNLTSPIYCLFNGPVLISCNYTGVFTGLAYGSYCMEIENGCNDTTIQRCFTVAADPLSISLASSRSCTINRAYIEVHIISALFPCNIDIYNPSGTLVASQANITWSWVYFDNIAALPAGLQYTVTVSDACGNKTSSTVQPVVTTLAKNILMNGKCPGGLTVNGSSDIQITLASNLAIFYPRMIESNGSPVSKWYDYSNAGLTLFTFSDLAPGTYIFESTPYYTSCGTKLYDTVVVMPYQYPSLQNSSIYQCDNNGFGVNAVVNGGVAPFNYEIIGSAPALPSIVSPAQASPGFNINNGTTYSLVRLRTIDGCGNASINDASVMPLANIVVSTQNHCMFNNITLHVDTIPNAVYTWYKRVWPNDSIQVGSTVDYNIASLSPADTGTYICKVIVNNGCLIRVSSFVLTGQCNGTLPLENVVLTGKKMGDKIQLNWTSLDETDVKEYIVERRSDRNQPFRPIASMAINNTQGRNSVHMFQDNSPDLSVNHYRIKVIGTTGKIAYSNEVNFTNRTVNSTYLYPNPATDMIHIRMNNVKQSSIIIRMFEASGRIVTEKKITIESNQEVTINRPAGLASGYYFVSITDSKTGISENRSVIFR